MDAHDEKLKRHLATAYEVRLRRQGEDHILAIPELNLRRRGRDLPQLYAQIEKDREELITELVREDLEDWIIPPGGGSRTADGGRQVALAQPFGQQMKLFLAKVAIVLAMLALVGGIAGNAISGAGGGLQRDFDAILTWPDSKVEAMRKRTNTIMTKLGPVIREIQAGWATPAQTPDATTPQGKQEGKK